MKTLKILGLAGLLAAGPGLAADEYEGEAKDAWIAGKVETVLLLNRHLNNFAIDSEVENGHVVLTGAVESDIDRDLAGSLVEGIDGVTGVDNELRIDGDNARTAARDDNDDDNAETDGGRTFGTFVDDATTTAAIKTKLVAEGSTQGLEIDVDTHEDVVTLSGRVNSEQEKDLAEEIAMNTGDVERVRNNLVVDPE